MMRRRSLLVGTGAATGRMRSASLTFTEAASSQS